MPLDSSPETEALQIKSVRSMTLVPFDTKPEIAAMQAKILDAMSGEQRVLLAFEMSHYTHELAKQGIRDEHPDWPEEKVTREFLRSLFPPGEAPQGL